MLYRKAKRGVWYVKFKHRGDTVRKSTGTPDRRKAEVKGRRLRVEHEQQAGPGGRRAGVTLSELAGEDVKRALDDGADPTTRVKTLEWIWSQVLRHVGEVDIGALTFDVVTDYVGRRRRAGAKGQTIRREVQAIKRGLTMAERRGWIGAAPKQWPKIKSDPPDEKQRGKLVHPDAIRLVLERLHADARDEVMFVALTGLRAAEVKRLRASWVEPLPRGGAVPALLRLPAASTKTRSERMVGLSAPALAILQRRIKAAPERANVFSGAVHKKALVAACERAGVPRFTLRDLRHTYATLALQQTADAVAVQAALGHTDLRTTQRYLSSTVARTASASAGVASMLDFGEMGSPAGGHLRGKNSIGARSSLGQSTGLLSASRRVVACECCAAVCSVVHGKSHTCETQGARLGGPPDERRRIIEFPRAKGGASR